MTTGSLVGLVLAAGAGSRFGMPKALARRPDGVPWVRCAVDALRDGGCEEVVVVLGASYRSAAELVPEGVRAVRARDWATGQAASVRAGLLAAAATEADRVLITLVDLPGQTGAAVRRVADGSDAYALRRAHFAEVPGHPVLIGRAHWAPLLNELRGDQGAGRYLDAHGADLVDCTDLGGGQDIDARNSGAA